MDRVFEEHRFLAGLQSLDLNDQDLIVPNGDDAAVAPWNWAHLVVATDAVVDGVHASGDDAPMVLAQKALRSNLSDLASMGAEAKLFTLAIALPRSSTAALAQGITEDVARECRRYNVAFAGGDTVVHDGPLGLTGTLIGRCWGEPIRRSGAREGDLICVTGALGGSLLSRHAHFEPRMMEAKRLCELGGPTSMTDISDGLSRDLANLASASHLGADIESAQLPIHEDALVLSARDGRSGIDHALNDGEDFELLFTWPKDSVQQLQLEWNLATPITVIGRMTAAQGLRLIEEGRSRELAPGGFGHGA